jgi:hypothetical protein
MTAKIINKPHSKNADKELFDKITKIKKRVKMFTQAAHENEWQTAQSFQLTNLIKMLLAKKTEMEFPFKSKKGNKTNDKIKITGDQKGIYIDTKRNVKIEFIYYTLPSHISLNKKSSDKLKPKSPARKSSAKKASSKSPAKKASSKSPAKKASSKSPVIKASSKSPAKK